jgi:hypothetical protein
MMTNLSLLSCLLNIEKNMNHSDFSNKKIRGDFFMPKYDYIKVICKVIYGYQKKPTWVKVLSISTKKFFDII